MENSLHEPNETGGRQQRPSRQGRDAQGGHQHQHQHHGGGGGHQQRSHHHNGGHSHHHSNHGHGRRGHWHQNHPPHLQSSRTLQSVVEDAPLYDVEVAEVDDGGLRVRTLPRIEAVPPSMPARHGAGSEPSGGAGKTRTSLREAVHEQSLASTLDFLSPLCNDDGTTSDEMQELHDSSSSLYSSASTHASSMMTDDSSVPSLPSLTGMLRTADFKRGGDAFSVMSGNSKSTDASSLASSARRIKSERAVDDIGRLMNLFGVHEDARDGGDDYDVLGAVPEEASEALGWSAARVGGGVGGARQNIVGGGAGGSRRSIRRSSHGRKIMTTNGSGTPMGRKDKDMAKPRTKAEDSARDKSFSLSPRSQEPLLTEDAISTSSPKGPDDEGSPEDASVGNFMESLKEIQDLYKDKPDKYMSNLRRMGDKYGLNNETNKDPLTQAPKLPGDTPINPSPATGGQRSVSAHRRDDSAGNDSMSTLTTTPSKQDTAAAFRDRRELLGALKQQHNRTDSAGTASSADNAHKLISSLRRIGDMFDLDPDDNTTVVTALSSLLRTTRPSPDGSVSGGDGEHSTEDVEQLMTDLRHLGTMYGVDVDDELSTLDGSKVAPSTPTVASSKRTVAGGSSSSIIPQQLMRTLSIPSAPVAKHGSTADQSSSTTDGDRRATNIQRLREKYGIQSAPTKVKTTTGGRKLTDLNANGRTGRAFAPPTVGGSEGSIRHLQDHVLSRLALLGEKQRLDDNERHRTMPAALRGRTARPDSSSRDLRSSNTGQAPVANGHPSAPASRSDRSARRSGSSNAAKRQDRPAPADANSSGKSAFSTHTATTAAGSSHRSSVASSAAASSESTAISLRRSGEGTVGRTTALRGKGQQHALATTGKSSRGRRLAGVAAAPSASLGPEVAGQSRGGGRNGGQRHGVVAALSPTTIVL